MNHQLSIQDFNAKIKECKDKNFWKKLKAMQLYRIYKKSAKEIASILYIPINRIYQWALKYKKYGFAGLLAKQKGGRKREIMAVEQEKNLLDEIVEDSSKSLVVIANNIQKSVEQKIGKKVFLGYAYSLLKRHAWRKITPRPKNPNSTYEK